MQQYKLLTLLSDFGLSDVYVGVMKGAIAQVNSSLTVVDLTHQIPPQNLGAARFCLMNAYSYFPAGTVHVAVVDPGVGSSRRAIAVEFGAGFLVGPDNGIFSGVLSQSPAITAVQLTNPRYWSRQPSATFHGRDIFAPIGATLASGVSLEQVGTAIDPATLVQLDMPECTQEESRIFGCIQYIDSFGNLVTNIPAADVQGQNWSVIAAELTIPGCHTYSDRTEGQAIALIGSHGWVEIAINGGSAQTQLQLDWGAKVQILLAKNI